MSYSPFAQNLTTGSTITVAGIIATSIVAGGVRTTSSSTAPVNPIVGDIWYKTTTDDIYRYTSDGTNSYWLDITGPVVTTGSLAYFAGGTTTNNVVVNNSGASNSTNTGALTVAGGVGIGGNLYVGGMITANTLTIAYTTITNVQILSTDTVIISNNAVTNSPTTGALQVTGGAGIGGSLYVNGVVTATTFVGNATTASYATTATTSTNASVAYSTVNVLTAGTGLSGSTFNGSTAVTWTLNTSTLMNTSTWATTATFATTATNAFQATQATTATNAFQATQATTATNAFQATQATTATSAANAYSVVGGYVSSITAGTDTVVTPTTGAVTIWDSSTLQSVTGRGASTTNAVTVNNSTNATSTNSGALQIVNGGLGVGGNIWLGGILSFKSSANVNGISFNNNSAGTGTEALLADYETGTFTVTDQSGAGLTITNNGSQIYTKIGNMVYAFMDITYPATANTSGTSLSLPFTAAAGPYQGGYAVETNAGWVASLQCNPNAATGAIVTATSGISATNLVASGKRFAFTVVYRATF
jgi:hypothetical protein